MTEILDNGTRIAAGAGGKPSTPTRVQAGWIIALLAVLVIGLGGFVATLSTGSTLSPIQQWEYKIVSPDDWAFEAEVNKLGTQGWELVSARRATSGSGYSSTASYEMILKRPLSANSGSVGK